MPDDLVRRPATPLHLRAAFAPETWNAEARTIDVIWTTGADVNRRDWYTGKQWVERLNVSAEAVDLARLEAGAPVLDSHSSYSLGDVVGVVERAWIEGGKGYATLRFSEREEVAGVVRDVAAGILRNISVGYVVDQWDVAEAAAGRAETRTAKRWTPYELSLVPIPADAGAQVRSGPPSPAAPAAPKESNMPDIDPAADAAARTADLTAAIAAERERNAEIMAAARSAGLPADWAERHIAAGTGADMARKEALEEVSKRATPRVSPAVQKGESGDDPVALARAMGHALAVRAMPSLATAEGIEPRFREFSSIRPSDMLIELAAARGERVGPRDRQRLVDQLFARSGGGHTSSDFPLLLEAASNKMLEAGYALATPTYRRFFAQKSFTDFKAHRFLTAGDFPSLAELTEGGGIAEGSISEKRENVTARTYARQVKITRQMLINDDLGAFADFSTMIGRRVANDENALAFALVNTASGAGPTLAEGNAAVFTTGRGNRPASGGAIAEATLDIAYAGMMGQTSLDGLKLNIQPRILLTGSAYRGAALRFTSRISPEAGANVGLYSDLEPIADANVVGNRWYTFADPQEAPVYVYGYVNGQTAPMVRVHQYVPGTDGIAVELVHDFAVGAIDFRGGYFNPGA
jgi:hypothetical protein